MISHIQGRMVEKNPTDVVVECNGVGYFLNISLHTYSQLPASEDLKLFTHLIVREDAQILYGFITREERDIFKLLITVSGVGPATARTMLSSMTPSQIVEAISSGDAATVQTVKGIGTKTAQRVIVDLRDKIGREFGSGISLPQSNTSKNEALSALETLGFVRKKAEQVCDAILEDEPEATVEKIIKLALKRL